MTALLDVIGLFYDSVLDESKWSPACEALADFVGGTGVGFVIANPQSGTIAHCESVRVHPDFTSKYLDYYAGREIRLAPAIKYAPGLVMTERMLLEKRKLLASEIYADLLLPCDVPHFMFAWTRKAPTAYETLAIENSLARGEFETTAIERYRTLLPHVSRAIRMRDHVAAVRRAEGAYRAVLDVIPYGILFLDDKGLVVEVTRVAERVLEDGSALGMFRSSVRAVVREDDARLQRAIDRAIRSGKDRLTGGHSVHVSRPGRATGLTVHVVALRSRFTPIFTRPASAMLMIIDPECLPLTAVGTIKLGLGLTDAEARLVLQLFKGESLRQAAVALDVSVNTAKSQLKSIYVKTDSRNHAQLVRKVMALSLVLDRATSSTGD